MNGEKPKARPKPACSRSHAQRVVCRDSRDVVTWAAHAARSASCFSARLSLVVQYMDGKASEDLGVTKKQRVLIANATTRLTRLGNELKEIERVFRPIAQRLNPEERLKWVVVDNESAHRPGERLKVLARFPSQAAAAEFIERQDKAKVLRGGFGLDGPSEDA